MLFPSNSPKAISLGLAGFLRAFFFGHSFGPQQAFFIGLSFGPQLTGGFVFPSNASKAMSVGLAGLLRAFFFGHSSGPQLTGGFVFPLKLAKGNERWPCQLSACLLSVTPSAFSVRGHKTPPLLFPPSPLFFSKNSKTACRCPFRRAVLLYILFVCFKKIITFRFLQPAAAAYRRRTAPDGPPSCPPRRPPGCRSGSPAAAAAGQGFGPQPGPWPG